jgi:ribosomal protein L32
MAGKPGLIERVCRNCGKKYWAARGLSLDKEQLCVLCYKEYLKQLPEIKKPVEKVLKGENTKDNTSASEKNMVKNPLKKVGEVAKGGVAKTFGQLKQKYGNEDMVDTSGTFLATGGREKKSIFDKAKVGFGKAKAKYGEWDKRRSEAARMDKYFTVKKCPKCGQMHTGSEPCPSTGKPETGATTGQEGGGEEQPGKITKGKIGLIGASILGMIGGYFPFVQFFPELANSFLVVGGTSIAMISLSMFTKPKHQSVFIPLWLLTSAVGLYATGSLAPAMPMVKAAVNDVKDVGKNLANGWNNFMCFLKTNDINCWEPEPEVEQNVNKIGDYQTLQLSEGRKTSTGILQNLKPVSGERYSYDVTLKNMNDNIYEINITEIKAWAENETFPADHVYTGLSETNPYVLKPKEELPVEFMWGYRLGTNKLPECPNGIITFKINVSSRQYGGGFSNYGIAPSDQGDHIKFLHYFDPETTAEPGPINIYVYTSPYAIDWSYFSNNGQGGLPFYIIIKITNPKVQDSVATLDKLYLVQTFEAAGSQKFFSISKCQGDLENSYTPTDKPCPSGKTGNCYEFSLNNLTVNFDEGREIVCEANILPNNAPTDDITDQIRVYAPSYEFKQKFVYIKSCKIETTVPTIETTASIITSTMEPSPHL